MNCMYSNQECSSGCESGWTLYLEHSSISSYNQENQKFIKNGVSKKLDLDEQDDDDDEEGLSMVSDASSGPQHFHEEEEEENGSNDNGSFYHNYPIIEKGKDKNRDKKRRRNNAQDHHQQSSLLDDTASSPFFDYSDKNSTLTRAQHLVGKNELEYSQGYSSTQFEVRPSTEPENQLQQNQWFEGKRW